MEVSESEPHPSLTLVPSRKLFSEINFPSTSLENLGTSRMDNSLLLVQVTVSWLHSLRLDLKLERVKEYWLSFVNLGFHLVIVTLKGECVLGGEEAEMRSDC